MITIVASSSARKELLDVTDRYESQRTGLGEDFRLTIERQLRLVAEMPELFPLVNGIHRKMVLQRFPYVVYHRLENDRLTVCAVIHARRDPRQASRRLQSDIRNIDKE